MAEETEKRADLGDLAHQAKHRLAQTTFCQECGTRLRVNCPKNPVMCSNSPTWAKFCGGCGVSFGS